MTFDASQPFETVTEPSGFDPSKPFTEVAPPPEFESGPISAYFKRNFAAAKEANSTMDGVSSATDGAPKPPPTHADNLWQDIEAGFQISVAGLGIRKKAPDLVVPADAPWYAHTIKSAATLAGDLPAMVAGFAAGEAGGATTGAVVGAPFGPAGLIAGAGVGGVVGGFAGANAMPAALRRIMMDSYEKGDVQSFRDFWGRASGAFLDAVKAGTVGAVTGAVGGQFVNPLTKAAAEVTTMVGVGKAIEGEMPNPQDFIDAALLVGGTHLAGKVATRMRDTWAETGATLKDQVAQAQSDPVAQAEILSGDNQAPTVTGGDAIPAEPATTEGNQVSDAAKTILSNVGEKAEAASSRPTFAKFYKDFVDIFDPIKRGLKELGLNPDTLPTDENAYSLARLANDYKAKVLHFFEKGPLNFNTLAVTGKSFDEIIAPHQGDLENLQAFLISKRVLELEGRGINHGFDAEAASQVVKEGSGKYGQAAKEITGFQNEVLRYARDSGVLSADGFAVMKEANQSYIPFSRLFEPEELAGGKSGNANSLKPIKGSDRKIQDPFKSILENTETIIRLAEKNRAVDAFITTAENTPDQTLVTKVKAPMKPIDVSEEHQAALKEHGLDPTGTEELTVFRPMQRPLGENEFQVFRDGKREVYQTTKDLAEAFKALDGDSRAMPLIFKLMRGITAIKKIGLTFTPDFIVRNIERDQITAGVFSKGGVIPFRDMAIAMGDLWKKNDTYYAWLKSGGANGTYLDMAKTYDGFYELDHKTGIIDSAWNVVKTPVEFLRVAAELTEQATRLAEFKRVTKGETSGQKVFEGGFASREVTVDFQRMGAKVSALNAITAFQNANIQGLDRTLRAWKEDPTGMTAKAAALITTPSILLWYVNHDDPRYKEIPRWEKDTFWIVMTKDNIYRFQKPQELGLIFGAAPERLLDAYFTDNPHALKDFGETMSNILTPSFVPDALSPVVEQFANKSMFTGRPIVSKKAEERLPDYRYNDYTSETAKQLGKLLARVPGMDDSSTASPAVIENYIRAWSGTLGAYAVQLADTALVKAGVTPGKVQPEATLADIPFVKAFAVRYPSQSAQSIQDFWDNYRHHKELVATIKDQAKTGNFADVLRLQQLGAEQGRLVKLDQSAKALGGLSQVVRSVNANPSMTPSDKRRAIDSAYMEMIQISRQANQWVESSKRVLTP